jgi:putative CocE/NonD family hydrolase
VNEYPFGFDVKGGVADMELIRGRMAALIMAVAIGAPIVALSVQAPPASAAAPTSWSPQAATYGMGSHLDQPVTMSDGTVLRADVYYPTADGAPASGPFPVLLQQTPYGKASFSSGASALTNTDISYFVDRGYEVVIADVRGTGDSGGTFDLFAPAQATDGAALARWSAALPHADGKVGLFGESYMGIDQFLTVGAAGPNSPIKAMFPVIAGNDIFANTVTQGGIPDIEFSSFYAALVTGLNLANPLLEHLEEAASVGPSALAAAVSQLTPVEAAHSSTLIAFLDEIVNVETGTGDSGYDGPYWAARSPASDLSAVVADHIPAFLVGGWNDLFQAGEPLNYVGLQNLYDGRPQTAAMTPGQPVTPRYQLMMGPWQHVTTGNGVNLSAIELEWFDTWLLGQDTPLGHSATPLHLEELNSAGPFAGPSTTDTWVNAAQWPIPSATPTAYYLGGGGDGSGTAPLSLNDGTLSTSAPKAGSGADTVLWDGVSSPCDIQTDQWSAGFLALLLGNNQPCDNNDDTLEAGPGSLTYTTAPFTSPKVLSGPIDATLYTTSTTTDTELAATVELVSPSGQSLPLTSGALDGDQRALDTAATWTGSNGLPLLPVHPLTGASLTPIVPGQVTPQDIQVFPTTALIPKGWRLRVTISTGDTPHLLPTLAQLPHLLGGVYEVERHMGAASFINVPLASPSSFFVPCASLCSENGP